MLEANCSHLKSLQKFFLAREFLPGLYLGDHHPCRRTRKRRTGIIPPEKTETTHHFGAIFVFSGYPCVVKRPLGRFSDINPLRDLRYSPRGAIFACGKRYALRGVGIYIISRSTEGRTYRMSVANISHLSVAKIYRFAKQTLPRVL